ncbi:MAG: 2OG-Fe(II) oxygenase [Pseudomonadota bacterium]|nr:2OG-Fe(II) oxygenase [Pseudomonadota bacterium]
MTSSGISIRDRFIAADQIHALLQCARARQTRGDFAPARIGGEAHAQRREEIRGDFTCWLREPLYPAERLLLEQLEQLRLELNREAYLGLFELELHYARYPPGAGYARHVDQPMGTTLRKVSLVLYLNVDWERPDGGVLRIHETDDRALDVEPVGGRLVCFLTPGREHEVLPARRERLSISGWFRGRE